MHMLKYAIPTPRACRLLYSKAYSEANTAMVEKRVELLTQLQDFEESKLRDLKSMLRDFIQAQMWYFSRGLETLSRAYENIDGD